MGKLVTASTTKYYIGKYFFLVFGLIQWSVSASLLLGFERTPKIIFVSIFFIALGSALIYVFLILAKRIKRVAVGKNEIVVFKKSKKLKFDWNEVDSIDLVPFFNLYKINFKSFNGPIYFFPSKNINPAYDLLSADLSRMGEIVSKKKKKLGI